MVNKEGIWTESMKSRLRDEWARWLNLCPAEKTGLEIKVLHVIGCFMPTGEVGRGERWGLHLPGDHFCSLDEEGKGTVLQCGEGVDRER